MHLEHDLVDVNGGDNIATILPNGDFVVKNASTSNIIWSAGTAIDNPDHWGNSLEHAAHCDNATVTNSVGECDRISRIVVDDSGLYGANRSGYTLWRPELGDLDFFDTSTFELFLEASGLNLITSSKLFFMNFFK